MAKVQKENIPLKPGVFMIGTPQYMLAKFLDRIIKTFIPDTYLLRSTEHFIDNLKQVLCSKNDTIVSFDVVSLFTNVPLKETIEIAIDYLYADTANVMPVDKVFRKLINLATQEIFMINEKFYKQVNGVIMVNPLCSTSANFFFGYLEERYLQIWIITVVCYRKFILDISTMCTLLLLIQILALVSKEFLIPNKMILIHYGKLN